jgi:hypothetical protein
MYRHLAQPKEVLLRFLVRVIDDAPTSAIRSQAKASFVIQTAVVIFLTPGSSCIKVVVVAGYLHTALLAVGPVTHTEATLATRATHIVITST